MKMSILFFTGLMFLPQAGCQPEAEEPGELPESGIIVRAASEEAATKTALRGAGEEVVVFTGEDILWFNETTGELRFINNSSNAGSLTGLATTALRFYIGDEYLFSSMIRVSDLNSQIFNSLVFHYSQIENKFYLRDGYPQADVLSNPQMAQEIRDENMRKIASEWSVFIAQLKKEERYRN
jgi:hypothetical protein